MRRWILMGVFILLALSYNWIQAQVSIEHTDGVDSYWDPWKITYTSITDNNDGSITVNDLANPSAVDLTITKADPSIIFDVTTATDTDFWIGVQDDGAGDDDDTFQIGDGTTPGTNPFLTIDTSGNVGIGTTSPDTKLEIVGALAGSGLHLDSSTGAGIQIDRGATSNDALIDFQTAGANDWRIGTGQIGSDDIFSIQRIGVGQVMVFDESGNVGIGTTSPDKLLHLYGSNPDILLGGSADNGDESGRLKFMELTGAWYELHHSGSTNLLTLDSNTTASIMTWDRTNGNVGIGTTGPESNLHIETTSQSATNFLQLEGNRNAADTEVGILFKDRSVISGGQEIARIWTDRKTSSGNFDLVFQAGSESAGGLQSSGLMIQGASGNVGIGTTSPGYKLEVDGTFDATTITEGGTGVYNTTESDAVYQPLEATLTDIADGTINENLVNTTNPWADNEVSDTLTSSTCTGNAATVTTNANLTGEVTSTGNAAVLDPTCISGKVETTIVAADHLLFLDATDSALKKVDAGELLGGAGDLKADGSVPLTANWDVGNYDITLKALTGDGTIEGATLTEGGNAVYNSTETPGGSLGGTWASPTIDDLFIKLGGDVATAGTYDFGSASVIVELPNSTADTALANAGEININATDDQICLHMGATGEVTGEVTISVLNHISVICDPGSWYDSDTEIFIMTLGDDYPEGIIIDEWKVSCNVDPDVEMDLDLKYADAWIGLANAAVIDVLDTTNGVSSEDTDANINGGAAVVNGKVMYLSFGSDPEGSATQLIVEIFYHGEED